MSLFRFYNVATSFTNGMFVGTLTAGDPDVGDQITWSIQGGDSGKFEIDAGNGSLTYTGAVTTGGVFTFNATVTSNGETDKAVVKVGALALISIDFTSDNLENRNIIRDDGTFADQTGPSYHDVEWVAGAHADPLTHTMDTKVELQVKLAGIPTDEEYGLWSTAQNEYLNFFAMGQTGGGQNQSHVDMVAVDELPNVIGQIDKPISWWIIIDGQVIQLGTTQNKIYVTYDTPAAAGGVVTEKRIDWLTSSEVAGGLGIGDEQAIVAKIHDMIVSPARFQQGLSANLWSLLDGDTGECINHVRLIHAAVNQLGVPTGKVVFVYPNLVAADKGEEFPDDNDNNAEISPTDPTLILRYLDSERRVNAFEAVYKVTAGGVTKYYGGFSGVFDSEEDVMGVAFKLVWTKRGSFAPVGAPFDFK